MYYMYVYVCICMYVSMYNIIFFKRRLNLFLKKKNKENESLGNVHRRDSLHINFPIGSNVV